MINLAECIDKFANLNVLVIGDAMLDRYLEGIGRGLASEAPVPIVTLMKCTDAPGGAANSAANIAGLGGHPMFLSVVGDDPPATALREELAARGVATDHLLVEVSRRTLVKQRIVASGQMVVRLDQGSTDPLSPEL